jgi:hypothetical protein
MDKCSCACIFGLGLLCLYETDSPPGGRRRSVRCSTTGYSSCSSCVLVYSEFDLSRKLFRLQGVCGQSVSSSQTVRAARVALGRSIFCGVLLEVREPILDSLS